MNTQPGASGLFDSTVDAMSVYESPLAQAQRHVDEGEVRVAAQEARVAFMATRGWDTTLAEDVLRVWSTTLDIMRDDLRRLEGRLGQGNLASRPT
jgi:hypothetical protein